MNPWNTSGRHHELRLHRLPHHPTTRTAAYRHPGNHGLLHAAQPLHEAGSIHEEAGKEVLVKVINEPLLSSMRVPGLCESCRELCMRREPHHILTRGMGGASRMDVRINLVSLCPPCHRAHHDGNDPLTCDLK